MDINISSRKSSDKELHLQARGSKFKCESRKHEWITFTARIDNAINRINSVREDDHLFLKQRVCSTMMSIKPIPALNKDECKVLKYLKKGKSISIVWADKGNVTAVIDADAYKKGLIIKAKLGCTYP